MFKWLAALLLGMLIAQSAVADGMIAPRYRSYYEPRFYLPPERHVVEVVQPPWSGRFIINGHRFAGRTPACFSWAAGERIKLIAGDWHGRCDTAVFYNFYRRTSCEMSCGWGPY